MQNTNPSIDKMHHRNCGVRAAANESTTNFAENVMESSAKHERLYKAATVAAALLLLAGAAAA